MLDIEHVSSCISTLFLGLDSPHSFIRSAASALKQDHKITYSTWQHAHNTPRLMSILAQVSSHEPTQQVDQVVHSNFARILKKKLHQDVIKLVFGSCLTGAVNMKYK